MLESFAAGNTSELCEPERFATSLLETLVQQADGPGITLYQSQELGQRPGLLSRDELLTKSSGLARFFRDQGMKRGDRVLLLLPTGRPFLFGVFATWIQGAVSVPVAHQFSPREPERWRSRVRSILRAARPRFVVGTVAALAAVESLPELDSDAVLVTDTRLLVESDRARGATLAEPPGPDEIAHVQFTSGSTGQPKGVWLTHGQLMETLRAAGERVPMRPADRFLSWLPLHHDMGFIGGLLYPMAMGIPQALLPTELFMRAPAVWLTAISKFRATLSPAPTFAYDLLATRLPERRLGLLDLSCWRYGWVGAEPIFARTLERFTERFRKVGLGETMLSPCYGLAEATLAVTAAEPDRPASVIWIRREPFRRDGVAEPARPGDPSALAIVGVGRPLDGFSLALVDEQGEPVGERDEGRILLAGDCVARSTLTASGPRDEEPWLDTGDLGFRVGDELYVTGRAKDLIIRGGVNTHPHWLEKAAESDPELRPGRCAAVTLVHLDAQREEVVLVAEPNRYPPRREAELKSRLRTRVLTATGVQLDRVELVRAGSLPKTTSGKLQRSLTAELLRQGAFG